MTPADAIRKALSNSPLSQNGLASVYGVTRGAMSQRMRRGTMEVDFLVHVLDICGYELHAVPKGSRPPAGSIRVEASRPTPAQGYADPRGENFFKGGE